MIIKSTQKFIRTSPRKLRLLVKSVIGLSPTEAITRLKFAPKRSAHLISKVIKTTISDAKNNFKLDPDSLTLHSIQIQVGPTLKRGRAVSRGRSHQIKKRMSHIHVTLESKQTK